MKKLTLSILLMACSCFVGKAQDVMVLKDASEMEVKVTEIRSSEVAYKKWDFQEGPTYTIEKSKVLFIRYENGSKEVFNAESNAVHVSKSTENNRIPKPKNSERPYIKGVMFNAYTEFGCVFNKVDAGPTFDMVFGARIYDYGFIGIGTGLKAMFYNENAYSPLGEYIRKATYVDIERVYYELLLDLDEDIYGRYVDDKLTCFSLPIYVNMRGYYPINKNFSPFVELSLGANLCISETGGLMQAPFYLKVGAGLEYKRLVFGMGYEYHAYSFLTSSALTKYDRIPMGYVKLGVRIGKLSK